MSSFHGIPLTHGTFLDRKYSRGRLQNYVTQHVQVPAKFGRRTRGIINRVVSFAQQKKTGFSVEQSIKGGSQGKGTAVKDGADTDLVLFLDDFTSMDDVIERVSLVIEKLKGPLGRQKDFHYTDSTPYSLEFYVRAQGVRFEVDLLPRYDCVEKLGLPRTYELMQAERDASRRHYYSACLTRQQLEFVKTVPESVKRLIWLVKHWKKTLMAETKFPSYALELVTIHEWQQGGSKRRFDIRIGFKAVMQALAAYKSMSIWWTENYTQADMVKYSPDRTTRPYILDPANPFNNIATSCDWYTVPEQANQALHSQLLQEVPIMSEWIYKGRK